MTDLTMFSKVDADRILKRAAELEGSEDSGPLSVDELRSIASEAGFGAHAVERAIAEAQQAESGEVQREPVRRSGLVITHISVQRLIPVDINSEQLMRAVRLFHPYRDGLAQVNLGVNEITWRDRKGLRFTVISSGGVTEIRVLVSKLLIRRRRWVTWVESAIDNLETLMRLVAMRNLPSGAAPQAQLQAGPLHDGWLPAATE